MKINIEGHEKVIGPLIPESIWNECDTFIEIHNEECQKTIFNYFNKIGINIFSQKIGWQKVEKINQVPITNKEGYIFVSKSSNMSWK